MSKQMLCSFFPAHCSHIFEPHLPAVLGFMYPAEVVEACPEQVLRDVLGLGIDIRRPFLAVFAVLGLLTGLLGALRIQSTLARGRTNSKTTLTQDPRFYWMFAFLFFGLMNLNGLFLHCLLPPTRISPLEQPVPWAGDAYTTGAFGFALWAAAMMESLPSATLVEGWTTWDVIERAWILGTLSGLLAVGWFLVSGYNVESILPGTLLLEMWYAGPPTILASHALLLMLTRNFSWTLCLSYALTELVFLIAFLDPFLCRQYGNAYLDLLTTPTLLFLGTDVVYLGLAVWLEGKNTNENERLKQM